MILKSDTVTITKDAIKHFGALGAVIIQELHNCYGSETIKKDVPQWRIDCLGFLSESTIKTVMTKLINDGKIQKDDEYVYLYGDGRPIEKIEVPRKKAEREAAPHWQIAEKLVEYFYSDTSLVDPKRHIRLAAKLHKEGYTIEYLDRRYKYPNGLWYQHEFEGQQGRRPTEKGVTRTIQKKYQPKVKEDDKSQSFFR